MKIARILAAASLLAASAAGYAQTYTIGTSLDSSLATGSVGTISFTDVAGGTRVDLLADWDSALLGNSVFLTSLLLNYDGTLTTPTVTGGSVLRNFGAATGAGVNAGFSYDYQVQFPTSARGNRLTDGESVSLLFAGASASHFSPAALVHLQGLTGGGSVKVITNPVPEPETWAMLGLGLAGVVLARRRKTV